MTDAPYRPEGGRHHVVVIGSGFGGLFAVQNLKNANVDITLIDRTAGMLQQPAISQLGSETRDLIGVVPSH